MTVTAVPIPGRDYGEVQLFATPLGAPQPITRPLTTTIFTFGGDAMTLIGFSVPPTVTAGSYLYANLLWRGEPPLATLPADLSASLRLYDEDRQLIAQSDGPINATPTRAWDPTYLYSQSAALPIPANLAPGLYSLEMVLYRQDNAEALPLDTSGEQVWRLTYVAVEN